MTVHDSPWQLMSIWTKHFVFFFLPSGVGVIVMFSLSNSVYNNTKHTPSIQHVHKDTQRHTKAHKDTQRHTKTHKDTQRRTQQHWNVLWHYWRWFELQGRILCKSTPLIDWPTTTTTTQQSVWHERSIKKLKILSNDCDICCEMAVSCCTRLDKVNTWLERSNQIKMGPCVCVICVWCVCVWCVCDVCMCVWCVYVCVMCDLRSVSIVCVCVWCVCVWCMWCVWCVWCVCVMCDLR